MCCPWNVADTLKTVLHVLNDNLLSSSCGGFNNERVHCNFKYLLWKTCVLHEDWAYLKFDHCTSWYTLCSSLSSFQDWRTFFPLQCNCLGDCLDLRFMDMMQFNDLLSIPTPFQWDREVFSLKWNLLLPTDIYYIYSCRTLAFTQHPYLQYYQNWTFLAWYTVAYWISMHVLSQRLGCDFTSFSFRFLKNVEQRSLWLLPHFLEVIIYIMYNLDSYIW